MIQMFVGEKHEVINLNALHDNGYSYLVEYGNMSSINPSSTDAVINGIGTFGAMVENNIFYINCTPDSGVVGTGITFNIFGQCLLVVRPLLEFRPLK